MCSRYSLTKEENRIRIRDLEILFGVVARYNVAPTSKMPVIIEDAKGIHAEEMKWGFKPIWGKVPLINAQSETIKEKPTFKKMLGNRCLIPADAFYEWDANKNPIRFTRPNHELMCFAGLWLEDKIQHEHNDEPVIENKFIILTTTPNPTVAKFHNRMPLIVHPEHYGWWIDSGNLWETVLTHPDKGSLFYGPVNRELNNVRNEGANLLKPE